MAHIVLAGAGNMGFAMLKAGINDSARVHRRGA